jgi:hypothetical protein
MHDVNRLLKDLNEALSQDKRHLGFLFGAGCPGSIRIPDGDGTKPLIPDIAGLTRLVADRLAADKHFEVLKQQFAEDGKAASNVEQMLTHVRNMLRVVGVGAARGLNSAALKALETNICKAVYDATCVGLPNLNASEIRRHSRAPMRSV